MRLLVAVAFATALLLPQIAWAACANTISVKDGAGATQTFCRGTDGGSNMISYFTLLDSAGTNVAAVTAGSALKVDGSAVTQPISGNVGQSGTWTVQPGNTANTTAWKVDGSAVTQPVSGTITANIGTAGTLALDASVTGLQVSQGSTTSGQKGDLSLGAVTTAAPSYTTLQSSPLSLTTVGALRVDNSAVTQPVSGSVTANIGTSGSLALDASVAGLSLAQASTTSGQKGALAMGAVTTSAPTYTTAQTSPLNLTTTGGLRVAITGNGGTALDAQTGTTVPFNALYVGGIGSGNLNPPAVCDNYTPFSFSSTSAQKIIAKATSKKIYICSINIVVGAATNVALIEGTKVTNECDTSTAGMAGGTTAATGWNLAANGGLTLGSGMGMVVKTANANFDVCLLASASNQVSGGISWTQF